MLCGACDAHRPEAPAAESLLKVGVVLECEAIAGKDKLRRLTVDVGAGGDDPVVVVTNAPNVAAGSRVVIAMVRGGDLTQARIAGILTAAVIDSGGGHSKGWHRGDCHQEDVGGRSGELRHGLLRSDAKLEWWRSLHSCAAARLVCTGCPTTVGEASPGRGSLTNCLVAAGGSPRLAVWGSSCRCIVFFPFPLRLTALARLARSSQRALVTRKESKSRLL